MLPTGTIAALLSAALAGTTVAYKHSVTGAGFGVQSKGVPYRKNINDLQAVAGPQWDLYIQAIQAMQNMDSDDDLSWFQLAGIHGMPFNEWDGAGPKQGDGWLGYCPHGEGIFVSWHRPYVMLFEQELVRHAIEIAQSYPATQQSRYLGAARALRAPFWDWAMDEALPNITVPTTLSINMPNGNSVKKVDVKNPFQSYDFPQAALDKKYGGFPSRSKSIQRCNKDGQTFPATANANLKSRNLKANLYTAYANTKTFEQFVSTSEYGVGMEQCHNWIHNEATCRGGSFAPSSISGFEPLFMLHHSNVDRLWAYWQYMQPNETIFNQPYFGLSRWGSPTNAIITPDSPLLPFRYSNGSYYTSRSVSDLAGRGYTYQGLEFWNKSAEELRKSATAFVNSAWGPSTKVGKRAETSAEGPIRQYFVRLGLDREEIERPASLDVYISGQLAGTIPIMAQPAAGHMNGSFVADSFVVQALASVSSTNSSLHDIAHLVAVNVVKPDGSSVSTDSIPSLRLALEEVDVTPSQSITELPVVGEPRTVSINLHNTV